MGKDNVLCGIEKQNRKRLNWVDTLRAVAMFFVVLHHASIDLKGEWIFNTFIGPIMIPLFFAISGFVFNDRDGKQLTFFWNVFKSLVVPWVFFASFKLQVYLIPFGLGPDFKEFVISVISGGVLWFFPALVFSEIILFYLCKFIKEPVYLCFAMTIFSLVGIFMADIEVGGFAMFNRGLIAQSFMLIGYLFRVFYNKFSKLNWMIIVFGWLGYIIMGIVCTIVYPEQAMNVNRHIYPNKALCFMMIFVGCFLMFVTFSKLEKSNGFVNYMGKNTIVCYTLHMYPIIGVRIIMNSVFGEFESNWLFEVINSFFAMIICAMVSMVINLIIPELVGKRRKRKQEKTKN